MNFTTGKIVEYWDSFFVGLGVYILVNEKNRIILILFGFFLLISGLILGYLTRILYVSFKKSVYQVSKNKDSFGIHLLFLIN